MSLRKAGIFVSDKRHFDYFNNLLRQMQNDGVPFELILNDTLSFYYGEERYPRSYTEEMARTADEKGYPWKYATEAAGDKEKYKVLVSTITYTYKIPFGKVKRKALAKRWIYGLLWKLTRSKAFKKRLNRPYRSSVYLEDALGEYTICFPRGMDLDDAYPPKKIDRVADHYFCHGKLDKGLVERNTEKPATIIGYPRYDNLKNFTEKPSPGLVREFGLDREKPVISWLPTNFEIDGSYDSNIYEWIELLQPLTGDYNIIVRPHPKRVEAGAGKLVETLQNGGFKVDRVIDRDMSELYASSDFVLCDYGGTIFSAVYTDCNLLLLNHSGHQETAELRSTSVDIKVREKLINLDQNGKDNSSENLARILGDKELWRSEKEKRTEVRDTYFGGVEAGEGSELASQKLKHLLNT